MSTLKGTTMHPRCRHIGASWDLLEWFQLFSTSQNTSQIQFRTFLKKNQIFWFPCCSRPTRENLSVDVSITCVELILTKPERFLFSAYENSGYGQNSILSILNFLNKIHIFGFPWCSSYSWRPFHWCINYKCRTDIDEAKVISALRQKSKFEFQTFLKKKIKFLGFYGVVLVKTFPLMYQLLM